MSILLVFLFLFWIFSPSSNLTPVEASSSAGVWQVYPSWYFLTLCLLCDKFSKMWQKICLWRTYWTLKFESYNGTHLNECKCVFGRVAVNICLSEFIFGIVLYLRLLSEETFCLAKISSAEMLWEKEMQDFFWSTNFYVELTFIC